MPARRELAWWFLNGQADFIGFTRDGFRWTGSVRSVITHDLFLKGAYQDQCVEPLFRWLAVNVPHWERAAAVINVGSQYWR